MTREEQAIEVIKAYRDKLTNSASNQLDGDIEAFEMAIKALSQEPCGMTAEEYRQRMIQAFHNADTDELIAVCVLPTEKEFEHLEWLLKNHYKKEPCDDCRNCKKWGDCECGRKGHINGTSIGYSIGECKDYEPCDYAISRILKRMWNCRGKHTTSIDKVKMEQIVRDELPSVTTKSIECDDVVSREAVKELIKSGVSTDTYDDVEQVCKWIDALPSVTQKSVLEQITAEIYEEFMTIDGNVHDKSAIKCMEIIGKYKGVKE
jgi:hypothetical protein